MIYIDRRRRVRPIRVVKIRDLGTSCPTQFEGETDDGKYIYIRYRYDILTVRIAETEEECFKSDDSKILTVHFIKKDDWCGEIDYDTVRQILLEKEIYLPVNITEEEDNIEKLEELAEKAKRMLGTEYECNQEQLKRLKGAIVASVFANDKQVKIFLVTSEGVKKLIIKGGTYLISRIEEVES